MQQALVNIKFLAAATVMDAVGSMPFPAEQVNGASLFSVGIDRLLHNLELASVKRAWTGPHRWYTALTYDAFEQLFIILVQWIKVHESSLSMLVEAVVDTSPPSSVLLVNPMASPRADAQLLTSKLSEWADTTYKRFGVNWALEPILHPATPLKTCLFRSHTGHPVGDGSSGGAVARVEVPAELASLPEQDRALASRGSGSGGFGYNGGSFQQSGHQFEQHGGSHGFPPQQAPFKPLAYQPYAPGNPEMGQKGQSRYPNKKGEKHAPPGQSKPHACAAKPLLIWKDPWKAQPIGQVLVQWFHNGVKNPLLQVQNGAGGVSKKPLCFFLTDPPSGRPDGCNGYVKNRKGHWVTCDRVHVDLAEDSWARADKATYASLWEFLQHPAVQEMLIASAEFTPLMA